VGGMHWIDLAQQGSFECSNEPSGFRKMLESSGVSA
jgi:hypothetical protein